jgi:kinesin family member 6/9
MHDTFANRGKVQYDAYSPEQQYEMQKIAVSYLDGEIEDIEDVNSLRQIKELFA